jgi:hypothetical protein
MVRFHTTSPDPCAYRRGQPERSSHADTAPSGRTTGHHRRNPSPTVSLPATRHCPVTATRVYRGFDDAGRVGYFWRAVEDR